MLRVHDMSVHYGSIQAVRQVSLMVGERELVAIIGSNGSGKSSLLMAITGRASVFRRDLRILGTEDRAPAIPRHRQDGHQPCTSRGGAIP